MNTDLKDVYDLYVSVAIHDSKEKQTGGNDVQWVTSKTATWH